MAGILKVGEVSAKAGETKRGFATWFELKDGTRVNLPVILVNGAKDGPKVVITSATHATELVGTAAVQYVSKRLDPSKVKGNIIIFPIANPLGMQFGEYVSPHDIVNLVKAYPGSKDGSITSRIANFIWENAKDASLAMDFHENIVPCLNFSVVGYSSDPNVEKKVMELAKAFGITIIRSRVTSRLPGAAPGTKSLTAVCMDNGIPAFTPEFVGSTGITFDENDAAVQVAIRGVLNVLKKLGMIDGEIEPQKGIQVMSGQYESYGTPVSNRGGIVHRLVEIGVKLSKGTPIAKIVDAFGDEVETIEMPIDGYIWGWIVGTPSMNERNWSVQTGSLIAFVFKDMQDNVH